MIFDEILRAFGFNKMPWVARVYLVVLGVFVLLLVFAVNQVEPIARTGKIVADSDPAMQVLSFSKDAIKLVLGALLGALSAGAKSPHDQQTDSN
jgi:hypothetical protein